jgi:hypothetical protein
METALVTGWKALCQLLGLVFTRPWVHPSGGPNRPGLLTGTRRFNGASGRFDKSNRPLAAAISAPLTSAKVVDRSDAWTVN